jgi:hypothetical protein
MPALGEKRGHLREPRDAASAPEHAALHRRHRARERERPRERPAPQLADGARAVEDVAGAVGVDHRDREAGGVYDASGFQPDRPIRPARDRDARGTPVGERTEAVL